MDRVNAALVPRTDEYRPLGPIPSDIWTYIVVKHIALREGRAIARLACVSRLFAQWTRPHLRPAMLYRDLFNARQGAADTALRQAMEILYELPAVDQDHRLELFLLASGTLRQHFRGAAIEPHVDTLLANIAQLPPQDQSVAWLDILSWHRLGPQGATQPRYLRMASGIGALPPSPQQAGLAKMLIFHTRFDTKDGFDKRMEAFMQLCRRLTPEGRASTLSALLLRIQAFRNASFHPISTFADEDASRLQRQASSLRAVHDCLQSIRIGELPICDAVLLSQQAMTMPALMPDDDEADRMAISLLDSMPAEKKSFYLLTDQDNRQTLYDCIETMLENLFQRGPQHSVSRFQSLYRAMAHSPASLQAEWMRSILVACATGAGATPALIVATAQAAFGLQAGFPKVLPDLFAVCLHPGKLRRSSSFPPMLPPAINPSAIPEYTDRFDANCGELMRLLREEAPDIGGKLLAAINQAYRDEGRMTPILAGPVACRTALYGRFLQHALAFLRSQPPATAAACLLQWQLAAPDGLDARAADERVISLLAALAELGRNNAAAAPELQAALAALMQNALIDAGDSPARHRRLLSALSTFPDDAAAGVLNHLLASRHLHSDPIDVLFASVIEASSRLPDALRSAVLATAAGKLQRFPVLRRMFSTEPATLLQARQHSLHAIYPGLQATDPQLHAYLQPGCISREQGLTLLLDAAQTLPARARAAMLRQLSKRDTFFDFANGHIGARDQLECSMRLLSSILGLPHDMGAARADVYAVWLKHFLYQFQGELRASAEERLLAALFALPAKEGTPLFDAYVDRIGYAPSKTALRERARANWPEAD